MRNFIEDVIVPFSALVAFVVAFVGVVIAVFAVSLYFVGSYQCGKYAEATNRDTKYVGGVCYVKDDNQWWGADEFNARITAEKLK